MSKHLFELMQQQEIVTSNFLPNKKEIEFSSKNFAKKILENGEVDNYELFAQAERIAYATANIRDEIKNYLPKEKHNFFGIEITPVNGRTMWQFKDDHIWSELKEKMEQREALLKVALKSKDIIYDSEGVEVPKISVKYASDSLQVKY